MQINFNKKSHIKNIEAGYTYLKTRWEKNGPYQSYHYDVAKGTCFGGKFLEIFTSAIILEIFYKTSFNEKITKDLLNFIRSSTPLKDGLFSCFHNNRQSIPPDVDTTSLCLSVLIKYDILDPSTAMNGLNQILAQTSSDGKIHIYFSNNESWLGIEDHTVCANVLYLVYLLKQEERAKQIKDRLYYILESDAFLKGSLYYFSPDVFLLMLARLLCDFPVLQKQFHPCLKEKIRLRIGSTTTPLDLAMRCITMKSLNLQNLEEEELLKTFQLSDGSWPEDFLYVEGPHERWLTTFSGCKELTTAFAIRALEF